MRIKQWQEYRKVDIFTFTRENEELVLCQESDIQRAFLGLDSPYIVKENYSEKNGNYNTDFFTPLECIASRFLSAFM